MANSAGERRLLEFPSLHDPYRQTREIASANSLNSLMSPGLDAMQNAYANQNLSNAAYGQYSQDAMRQSLWAEMQNAPAMFTDVECEPVAPRTSVIGKMGFGGRI